MNNPKDRSWTSLFVNPRFQLKLLSYFILLFIVTTTSLYLTTYLFFWNLTNKAMKVGIPEGHVFYQFIGNQKNDLDLLFFGLVAFNFILLLGVGFIVSHRIAGPIQKLKDYLASDREESLQFRETDFFNELGPIVTAATKKNDD